MKRFLCILLSLLLIATTIPYNVLAAENNTSERDELIELACEVFPEYASKIRNPNTSTYALSRSSSSSELVTNETRAISDSEYLIYTEYSDGFTLLTDVDFDSELTVTDRVLASSYSQVTLRIKATCTYDSSDYFVLSGVVCTLNKTAYDTIDDTGTYTCYGDCSVSAAYTPILSESASIDAQISYRLNFVCGPTSYYTQNSLLTLTVGDNTTTVTHVKNT